MLVHQWFDFGKNSCFTFFIIDFLLGHGVLFHNSCGCNANIMQCISFDILFIVNGHDRPIWQPWIKMLFSSLHLLTVIFLTGSFFLTYIRLPVLRKSTVQWHIFAIGLHVYTVNMFLKLGRILSSYWCRLSANETHTFCLPS